MPPGDPEYWPAFARLVDPPVGVFLRGRPLRAGHRRVAHRRVAPSLTTRVSRSRRDLGRGVAAAGLVVASGGAIGIDARAHEGALDAGGTTVAVLGSGIDVEYPATNRRLLREIAERGTLVSEYPPGVPAEPFRFPARNRLIAGLSIGVVIVEGVAHSGTRSTADYAVQLGLDVFAVPGPVTSELTEAPHELIRDGARLIRGPADLLEDLGIEATGTEPVSLDGLPGPEAAALAALREPMLPDAVSRATGHVDRRDRDRVGQARAARAGAGQRRSLPTDVSTCVGGLRGRPWAGCRGRGRVAADPHPGDCVGRRPLGRYVPAATGSPARLERTQWHPEQMTTPCPRPSAS